MDVWSGKMYNIIFYSIMRYIELKLKESTSRMFRIRMSKHDFKSEDILLEKALSDELLQVLLECPALDGRVSLVFLVGAVTLRLGKRRIMLEKSRAPNRRSLKVLNI